MSSDVEIRNEVVNAVRSVLTLSKDGFFFSDFVREYRTQMGENVPYQRLGYATLEECLHNLPDAVQIVKSSPHDILYAAANKKNAHVAKLVAEQRCSKPKGRFRPPPRRALPPSEPPRRMRTNLSNPTSAPKESEKTKPKPHVRPVPEPLQNKIGNILKHNPKGLKEKELIDLLQRKYDLFLVVKCKELGYGSVLELCDSMPDMALVQGGLVKPGQFYLSIASHAQNPTDIKVRSEPKQKFQELLSRHPNGIHVDQLLRLYEETFHHHFDLGCYKQCFGQVQLFCKMLPDVFKIHTFEDQKYLFHPEAQIPEFMLTEEGKDIIQKIRVEMKILLRAEKKILRRELESKYFSQTGDDLSEECEKTGAANFMDVVRNFSFLSLESDSNSICWKANLSPERLAAARGTDIALTKGIDRITLAYDYSKRGDGEKNRHVIAMGQCNSPDDFYFTLCGREFSSFEDFEIELTEFYDVMADELFLDKDREFIPGQYCAVKYIDNRWYRGLITRTFDKDHANVYYIDQGGFSKSHIRDIAALTIDFARRFPAQALRGRCAGIKAIGDEWSRKATERLLKLTDVRRYDPKTDTDIYGVTAQIKGIINIKGQNIYSLSIVDTTTNPDKPVFVNQTLVQERHALVDPDQLDHCILDLNNFRPNEYTPKQHPPFPKPTVDTLASEDYQEKTAGTRAADPTDGLTPVLKLSNRVTKFHFDLNPYEDFIKREELAQGRPHVHVIKTRQNVAYVIKDEVASIFEVGVDTLARMLDMKGFKPARFSVRKTSPGCDLLFERAKVRNVKCFADSPSVTLYLLQDLPSIVGLFKPANDPLYLGAKYVAQKYK